MRVQFWEFYNDEKLRFFIEDVQSKDRLHRAMNGTLKTNINRVANIIDSAIDNKVKK